MTKFNEKPQWTASAMAYQSVASLFGTISFLLGAIGLIAALILLVLVFTTDSEGKWASTINAFLLAMQSVMLIVFGSMMRGLSEVLLAVFEMSIAQTRDKIDSQEPKPSEG